MLRLKKNFLALTKRNIFSKDQMCKPKSPKIFSKSKQTNCLFTFLKLRDEKNHNNKYLSDRIRKFL